MKDKSLKKRRERVGKVYALTREVIDYTMKQTDKMSPFCDAGMLAQKVLMTAGAYMVQDEEGAEESFMLGCKTAWQIARQMESVETPLNGEKKVFENA